MNIWVPKTKILEPEFEIPGGRVAGRFRIVGRLDDGRERVIQDWRPNLITNAGLERWGTGQILLYCSVGGSSIPPTVLDTSLGLFFKQHNSVNGTTASCQTSPPYYGFWRQNFVFNPPGSNLAVAEVGVGWGTNGTNLWSRSLTQDSEGFPLVLSWLANETLTITYEARMYPWLDDVPHETIIGGVTHTGIIRPAYIAAASYQYFYNAAHVIGNARSQPSNAYSGDIGALTAGPSGTPATLAITTSTYSAGSLKAVGTGVAGPTVANFAGGVKSVLFSPSTVSWQANFTPTIAKLSTHTLTFNVSSGVWGRKA